MTKTLVNTPASIDAEFARIIDELTRRGFLTGAAGAAALLGLAACGSSGSDAGSPPSSAPTTRTVSTIHGNVTVPANPMRIIAFDFPEVCALLDLGITPAGRTSYVPNFPAYNSALKSVPAIDEASSGTLIIEKIAALNPDLILGDDWADPSKQRAPYTQLAKIAPTAIFAWEQAAGNWPTLAAETAAAIGKEAALAALKTAYNDQTQSIKTTYASLFNRTSWDIIDCSQDSWDLYSANSSHGKVLTGAGLQLNAANKQVDGYKQYSFEQFGLLNRTDAIITTPISLTYLRKQALYEALPAVKAGLVYTTELFFPASYGIATALLADFADICTKLQEGVR